MPLEGLQLGRYHFIRLLGSGGMGEVYLAEDPRINQQVAIKVIRAEATPYPNEQATKEASRLFQREAIAVAKLDHPHILPLFDYGESIVQATPLTYLVMPYRPEGSLVEWLRRRGTAKLLSTEEVASIIGQTSEALQHAHDRQIIHQDVKPSNLLIRERREDLDHPDILLADFGIARSTTATSSMSQMIRGTPTYMAPEQWEGQPVFATDQYALAIMAYELLTGRPPFQGGSVQMMYQHFNTQPQPPGMINTHLSTYVDAVILHALAKRPQGRFGSIAAFAQAFQHAVQPIDASTFGKPSSVLEDMSKPVFKAPLESPDRNEFRATLTISQSEARTGASRRITLPGGRQVSVSVPAGAYEGQIIRFEGLRELTTHEELAGTLILTLGIQHTEGTEFLSAWGNADRDVVVSNPHVIPAHASLPSKRRTVPLIVLVLLIVVGSLGFFTFVRSNQIATNNKNAIATTSSVAYPNIMGNYSGTIHNDRTNQPTTTMQLTINQNQGSISGYFTVALPLQGSGPFTGSIDTNKMIQFIVDTSADNLTPQANIKFYNGILHQDGSLNGNYCSVNPNNGCDPRYGGNGTWSVARQ